MRNISQWLKEEHGLIYSIIFLPIFAFVLQIIVYYLIEMAVKLIVPSLINLMKTQEMAEFSILSLLTILPAVAILEETIFRLPLYMVVKVTKRESTILFAVFALSLMFGVLHGFRGIFFQFPGGLIYSTIFLKAGGMNGKLLKPLIASIIAHTIFNETLLLFVLASGQTIIRLPA